ncbi:hypothetical protein AB1L42_15785 [Thalassoglobus sp. JC818]|uniref:hypothetical protein n=1 Tax=Thalassoglobus sp. JC818 TaxID=3232136 RepID=UPI00345B0864
MWCANCQEDVATEISQDGQTLKCTTCGDVVREVFAPSLHPETKSARELLQKWAEEQKLTIQKSSQPKASPTATDSAHIVQNPAVTEQPLNEQSSPTIASPVESTKKETAAQLQSKGAKEPRDENAQQLVEKRLIDKSAVEEADTDQSDVDDLNTSPKSVDNISVSKSVRPADQRKAETPSRSSSDPSFRVDTAHGSEQFSDNREDSSHGKRRRLIPRAPDLSSVSHEQMEEEVATSNELPVDDFESSADHETGHDRDDETVRTRDHVKTMESRATRQENHSDQVPPPPHFDMQNVRKKSRSRPGKVEAMWGQLLAYAGVGILTLGSILVLWGYFGAIESYASTGWLLSTAGQMLLLLGLVTLISGGMEQTKTEVTEQIEYLGGRMIRIEESTEQLLHGPHFVRHKEASPKNSQLHPKRAE